MSFVIIKKGEIVGPKAHHPSFDDDNSCSYSTNDLVFILSQICDQDLSRCLASSKDLKSCFGASTC